MAQIKPRVGRSLDPTRSDTILYALGSGAGQMLYNIFNTFIQFFYTSVVGLPAQWVGRGWFLFGFWNAVNDPIAGMLSDSKKSAYGRRKWHIRLLAIPVAIGFLLMWTPPFSVIEHGVVPVFIYFMVIISLYDLLQSMITLNVDALFPEMFQDHSTRLSGLTVVIVIGSVLGGLGVAFAPLIYNGQWGWLGVGVIFAVIAGGLYLLSLLGMHENPEYARLETTSLRGRLRVTLVNPVFRIVIGLNFALRFILAVFMIAMPFYTEYVLLLDGGQTAILLLSFIGSYSVSVILWRKVYERLGTQRAMIGTILVFGLVSLPTYWADSLLTGALAIALVGAGLGGSLLIAAQMTFAEMIDDDFVRTNVRREGLYRGILGFVFRLPTALAGLILGELLSLSGLDPFLGGAAQPEMVAQTIRLFVAVLPIFGTLGILYFAYTYPLTRQVVQANRDAIYEDFDA